MKKVLIGGSSGFIGKGLTKHLKDSGKYELYYLVRRDVKHMNEIFWDPENMKIDNQSIKDLSPDYSINLAGENAFGYWTDAKKNRLLKSRTNSTRILSDALSTLDRPPKAFLCSSAVSYYGTNIFHEVDENSPKGTGFFSDLTQAWEDSCMPLNDIPDTRIINLRTGIVLDPRGGMLEKMKLPFSLGLGGRLGDGKQWIPWISLRDAVAAIQFAIENVKVKGPLNLVSPHPCTNIEFTKALGDAFHKPTPFPVPEFVLNTLLGKEMVSQTMLASQRVLPTKLKEYGFRFQDTDLEMTLRHQINEDNRKK
eukprot:gene4893-6102_t